MSAHFGTNWRIPVPPAGPPGDPWRLIRGSAPPPPAMVRSKMQDPVQPPKNLDWNSVGCPEIESVTVSDFVDGTDLKYNYDRPLILTENEEIGGLEVDSAPAKSLQRWASTFAGSATASTSFRCAAPVSTVHGVKDVMEAFSPLLPATRAGLPGFVEKDCHSAWWFGYTSKHARFDMEPLGLGSLRYIYEGSMSVLLVRRPRSRTTSTRASRVPRSACRTWRMRWPCCRLTARRA